jgi:hypothetical protein
MQRIHPGAVAGIDCRIDNPGTLGELPDALRIFTTVLGYSQQTA